MRVCLIDDDAAAHELVVDQLESEDHIAEVVWSNSLDGLVSAMGADKPPDVVLLDLGLPESQGLDTFDRAKEIVGGRAPIVILSGTQPYSAGLTAMRQGAEHFVDKKHLDKVELGVALTRAVSHFQKASKLRDINSTGEGG